MGRDAQLQIRGPKEKWDLFDKKAKVRFRDGTRTPRRERLRALHDPDDFTASVAVGERWMRTETRRPLRLRRSATASRSDAAHNGSFSMIWWAGNS
jgi:hypothetical protein